MNESFVKVISALRELANSLEGGLKEQTKESDTSKNVETDSTDKKVNPEPITIETVRAVLAGLSQSGKQALVKGLIQKYGAEKLTSLDPTCYPNLLKDAEEL